MRGPGQGGDCRANGTAFKTAGVNPARERFAFVHTHIRVGYQRGKVIGVAAYDFPSEGPVKRQADLVNEPSLDE